MANIPGCCQAEWVDERIYELINRGYDIHVVSATHCFKYPETISHYRVPSILPFEAMSEYNEIKSMNIDIKSRPMLIIFLKAMSSISKTLSALNIQIFKGEGRWFWFIPSFITLFILTIRNKYKYIYSTGGPASAHLATILVSKLSNIKNIIELQDPLSGDDIGRNSYSKKALKIIERFIVSNASNVVYATKSAMNSAKKKYSRFSSKIFSIYPGAKENKKKHNKSRKSVIQFSYIGSLYQTRNLDYFLEAFSIVSKNINKEYSIDLYGWVADDVIERIQQYDGIKINLHGMISRELAHQKAMESDILLLVQHTDDRSALTIPFKIYDYLNTEKLILGLTYKNNEIDQILSNYGHLYCSADSVVDIKNSLNDIFNNYDILKKKIKKSDLNPYQAVNKMEEIIS